MIEKLAAVLPRYRLPPAVGTHSRHYMPLGRFKNGREETAMVLDTWAQIDTGDLGVSWAVDLTPEEQVVLAALVRDLGYLGRSESWVEGELRLGPNATSSYTVREGEAQDRPGPGWEQVSLLAAVSPRDYASWREQALGTAVGSLPSLSSTGKPLTKAQLAKQLRDTQAAYPPDLLACLQVNSAWLHELGWSQPPGTRKVLYWRPSDALEAGAPRPAVRSHRPREVEFMLLAIATASGNLAALPPTSRTLPQAELLHRALLSRAGDHPPLVLSGRDAGGKPLARDEAHRHAHLLHLDLDGDQHLDHVLIWAPMGLDAEAQIAVRAVRTTFTKGGTAPLRLALAAAGSRAVLQSIHPPLAGRLRALLGEGTAGATHWRSVTPFVPPRFLKRTGRNTLEGQIAAELAARKLPPLSSLRVLDPHDNDDARRGRHFVRARRFGSPPPLNTGFTLELSLTAPTPGPLALGYGCHFGLGLFEERSSAP